MYRLYNAALPVPVFTLQIRSSRPTVTAVCHIFANWMVTLSHSSANTGHPSWFKESNNSLLQKDGCRLLYICLCAALLSLQCYHHHHNAEEITCVTQRCNSVKYFIAGGQSLSVAPECFMCVCRGRVDDLCSVSLFYELFSHCLASSTHTETIGDNRKDGFTSILRLFAAKEPQMQNYKIPS